MLNPPQVHKVNCFKKTFQKVNSREQFLIKNHNVLNSLNFVIYLSNFMLEIKINNKKDSVISKQSHIVNHRSLS